MIYIGSETNVIMIVIVIMIITMIMIVIDYWIDLPKLKNVKLGKGTFTRCYKVVIESKHCQINIILNYLIYQIFPNSKIWSWMTLL